MHKKLAASAVAVLALALTVPAFAGGAHCSGGSNASAAASKSSCGSKTSASQAWAGAWLERSASGAVTVADVAKNSPAHKAGLKSGDLVLAVNGYDLADKKSREACAASAECSVGSAVTYKVLRGNSVKQMKVKLEKMPADAASRFANRDAEFDPVFAAVIVSSR